MNNIKPYSIQAHKLSLAALATSVLALAACGGGGNNGPQEVSVDFVAVAGKNTVKCGTVVDGLGSGSVSAQVKDFRFYIADVQLISADGTRTPLTVAKSDDWNLVTATNTVSLIDLEDGTGSCSSGTTATNSTIKGTVPAGSYVGLEMTLGVPFAYNHTDYATAAKPLDVQGMAWSWQSGRKFAKIEVTDPAGTTGTWSAKTFNMHLGSTGCTGNPATGATVVCTAPNRAKVVLSAFDPLTQKVSVDLQALLAGTDITVNQAGAAGCMSGGTDPECSKVFPVLGLDWKADGSGTGLSLNDGKSQTLFKAIAR